MCVCKRGIFIRPHIEERWRLRQNFSSSAKGVAPLISPLDYREIRQCNQTHPLSSATFALVDVSIQLFHRTSNSLTHLNGEKGVLSTSSDSHKHKRLLPMHLGISPRLLLLLHIHPWRPPLFLLDFIRKRTHENAWHPTPPTFLPEG